MDPCPGPCSVTDPPYHLSAPMPGPDRPIPQQAPGRQRLVQVPDDGNAYRGCVVKQAGPPVRAGDCSCLTVGTRMRTDTSPQLHELEVLGRSGSRQTSEPWRSGSRQTSEPWRSGSRQTSELGGQSPDIYDSNPATASVASADASSAPNASFGQTTVPVADRLAGLGRCCIEEQHLDAASIEPSETAVEESGPR